MRNFKFLDFLYWPGWLRAVFGLLIVAAAWRSLAGVPSVEAPAYGQIPDGGAQRKQLIDEAKLSNQLLTDIKRLLEEGTLNVRVAGADNPSDAQPKKRAP